MSKIKIKNFGPIKDGYLDNDGWIDIKKVTVFIGNQGSGKSTLAKVISTMKWIEKTLVRGMYNPKLFERKNKLKNQYLSYHRLQNYFFDNTEIDYLGTAYHLHYSDGFLKIRQGDRENYTQPQIVYAPSERNFISYVKNSKAIKIISDELLDFLTEYDVAINAVKDSIKLPINNVYFEYDKLNNNANIRGEGYKVKLTDSSSGFQSFVPLFLVSSHHANKTKLKAELKKEPMSSEEQAFIMKEFSNVLDDNNITEDVKKLLISVISKRFITSAFINIVEEPEQNLFPTSQWDMLKSLLEFNNMTKENKLIMTTHSPYIINYLTLAVKASQLYEVLINSNVNNELFDRLYKIVPKESKIRAEDLAIYELDEKGGKIIRLDDYNGLPSDENYLNKDLEKSNEQFDKLLEIEEECR